MSKLRRHSNPITTERVSYPPEPSTADDPTSLVPPRPRFMTPGPRSSWSSTTTTPSSENSEPGRDRSSTVSMPSPSPPLRKPLSQSRLRKPTYGADYAPVNGPQDFPEQSNEPVQPIFMRRPPPSSFNFPFQSHPGNPDPLPPRSHGRASLDSFSHDRHSSDQGFGDHEEPLPSPYAPFMGGPAGASSSPASSSSQIYKDSVAGNLAQSSQTHLPRMNSVPTFRSPFLSPASRPSSTIWTPPIQSLYGPAGTPNASMPQLVKKSKPPMPSTMLSEKISNHDKPWLDGEKGDRSRLSWWLTVLFWFLGLGAGAAKVYFDYRSIQLIDNSQLCPVFVENFDSLNFNDWAPDVQLSGFGYVYLHLPPPARLTTSISNNEFEMTTSSDKNLFVQNGQLYIHPTLTSDEIGTDAIFNDGSYKLDVRIQPLSPSFVVIELHLTSPQDCTNSTSSSCSISSDLSRKIVIPPVQSARISTKNSYNIRYGKVEVKAKLPRGSVPLSPLPSTQYLVPDPYLQRLVVASNLDAPCGQCVRGLARQW